MLLTALLLTSCLGAPVENQLAWYQGSFSNAVAQSHREQKPILIYFWSSGSGQCSKLYQETLSSSQVIKPLDDFIVFSADTGTKPAYNLVERFNVTTLPTLLLVDPNGELDDAIIGYIPLQGFLGEVERIQRGEGTVSALRAAVAAQPENLEARMQLAIKLGDVGDSEGFIAERAAIYAADPKNKQLPTSQMRLWDLQKNAFASEEEALTSDLDPVRQFLAKETHEEVLFEGWQWIAGVASYQEKPAQAREARMNLWKHVPDDQLARTGNAIASAFYEQREELSKKERRFALKVAQASLASVEAWAQEESCSEGCNCDTCSEGYVGDNDYSEEHLVSRNLYLARSLDTLACCYEMSGKRKNALAAIGRSIELDPENEEFTQRRETLAKRG